MKKYTQKEFDAIERDEQGVKQCPSGDYTAITRFGEGCSFGRWCRFGEGCSFGECCSFGERCSFGYGCRFGYGCSFGECCRFGEGCSFGEWCRFGECCSFGERCRFGEECRFGFRCSHEGLTNSRYIAVDRIGSSNRKTYFFLADEGYFVRAGCYFGKMSDFIKRVKEVHAGTKHEKAYLAAVRLAKILL